MSKSWHVRKSATSEYSTTSLCLSALLGRPGLGRVKFVLDGKNETSTYETSTYVTPKRPLSGHSAPIGAIAAVTTCPLLWRLGTGTVTVRTCKKKIHTPEGETLAPLRSRAQVPQDNFLCTTFQVAGRGSERRFGERTRERERA